MYPQRKILASKLSLPLEVWLINLCFADDLMVFCRGELSSIKHIHDALAEFESLSRLSPSPGKSNIFFSGVQPRVKLAILDVLGF